MAHYDIIVTHDRGDWRQAGQRKKVREFTLHNLVGTEQEAAAELKRLETENVRYRLRLQQR